MKLTIANYTPAMHYTGRIAHFRFDVFRDGKHWLVYAQVLDETTNEAHDLGQHRTLALARLVIARWWLKQQLMAVFEHCRSVLTEAGSDELRALMLSAATFRDAMDALALRDWLLEHEGAGVLQRWILEPGRKAHIHWPAGWEEIAKAGAA